MIQIDKEAFERHLYERVNNEELAPFEAELLAENTGIKLSGQEWPASFSDPHWPLAFAVLWIVWGDPENLYVEWDRFRIWAGHLWRDPFILKQRSGLKEAEAALWKALQVGSVHAYGLPGQDADYVEIPPIHWLNLEWMPGNSKQSVRNFAASDPRYRVVTVSSREMISAWPAVAMEGGTIIEQPKVTGKKISPSNQGGRIMAEHWHDMWAEVCRIVHDEGLPTNRLDLVKRMQQWFTDRDLEAPLNQTLNPILGRLFSLLNR